MIFWQQRSVTARDSTSKNYGLSYSKLVWDPLPFLTRKIYLHKSPSTQRYSTNRSARADVNFIQYWFEVSKVDFIRLIQERLNLADPRTKFDSPIIQGLHLLLFSAIESYHSNSQNVWLLMVRRILSNSCKASQIWKRKRNLTQVFYVLVSLFELQASVNPNRSPIIHFDSHIFESLVSKNFDSSALHSLLMLRILCLHRLTYLDYLCEEIPCDSSVGSDCTVPQFTINILSDAFNRFWSTMRHVQFTLSKHTRSLYRRSHRWQSYSTLMFYCQVLYQHRHCALRSKFYCILHVYTCNAPVRKNWSLRNLKIFNPTHQPTTTDVLKL